MELKELLIPERVDVQVEASTWEDAVRAVGRLMVDTGVVEERYIDGMIETVKQLGPYIVIAPGIAMPHALPEKGVLENCMAIITLDPPVEFGNEDNDPVYIVLAFGARDKTDHMQALRQVATVLGKQENVDALQAAKTKEDILTIMHAV